MRKLGVAGLVAVLALTLMSTVSGTTAEPMGVRYTADGLDGTLEFANARGNVYVVWDAFGEGIQKGLIRDDYFSVDCPNSGPSESGLLLRVLVRPDIEFCIGDSEDDWIWE